MLYPTLNQPIVILFMFLAGLLAGFVFDLFKALSFCCEKIKFVNIFFDFLGVVFSFVILWGTNLLVNFGQFRFYVLLIFLLAFIFQRYLSKFMFKVIKSLKNKKKIEK